MDSLRVLALIEATSVTGPAKNLIGFARRARPAVELTAATFRRAAAPDRGFLPALDEAGIPARLIDESGMGDPRVVPQLLALVRAVRPHIIQTHSTKSHFLLRLLRPALPRAPWIAFHHGFTNIDRKDRAYNRLSKWAMRGADRVVTVCEAFARDLRAAGVAERRISLRHNFVLPFAAPAPAEVEALRARLGIAPGVRVVLAVGRLSREKGHADLLDAAARLRSAAGADFRLVIAGEGPERANLEHQRASLHLDGIVLLPGQQSDLRPFYALADIAALPSHSEGSPNVLLESMAAGLPIVATRAGGIVEIATHEQTALLAPARDPQAFAAALNRLWTDPALAQRLAAQALAAAARFTPEAYVESMVGLYRAVLGGPPAAISVSS